MRTLLGTLAALALATLLTAAASAACRSYPVGETTFGDLSCKNSYVVTFDNMAQGGSSSFYLQAHVSNSDDCTGGGRTNIIGSKDSPVDLAPGAEYDRMLPAGVTKVVLGVTDGVVRFCLNKAY